MPSCPPGREWSRLRKFRSPGATGPSARAVWATERGGSAGSHGTSGRQERPDPPHERSGRRKGAGLRTVTEHPVARNDRILRASDPGDGKGRVCGQLRNIRSPGTTGPSARAIRATERGRSADSYGTSGRQERPDPPHERSGRRKGAGLRTVTEHPVARNDRTLRTSGPGDGKGRVCGQLRNIRSPGTTGSSARAAPATERGGSADSYGTSGRQERPDPPHERPGRRKGGVCGQLRNIRSPGTTGSSARAIRAADLCRWGGVRLADRPVAAGPRRRRGRPEFTLNP